MLNTGYSRVFKAQCELDTIVRVVDVIKSAQLVKLSPMILFAAIPFWL